VAKSKWERRDYGATWIWFGPSDLMIVKGKRKGAFKNPPPHKYPILLRGGAEDGTAELIGGADSLEEAKAEALRLRGLTGEQTRFAGLSP